MSAGREPIVDTRHLFEPLARELVDLVTALSDDQWLAPTCYPTWRVREIVAHLVQTGAGRLSVQRDGWRPAGGGSTAPSDFTAISGIIAGSNDAWERATAGLSPRLLADLLTVTEVPLATDLARTDPRGPAVFAVAWAGESSSAMWFDVAREFTERWHHQQQIRDAVGARSIATPSYLRPVIETFVRCLPFWFDSYEWSPGILGREAFVVRVSIVGPAGSTWDLGRGRASWVLHGTGSAGGADDGVPAATDRSSVSDAVSPDVSIEIDEDAAWRHWSRSIDPSTAARLVRVHRGAARPGSADQRGAGSGAGDAHAAVAAVRAAFLRSRAVMIAD